MRDETVGSRVTWGWQQTSGEGLFHRLLQVLPAGAYTCNANGFITYYNQRAVDLWGRVPKLSDPDDRFCGSFRLYSASGEPIAHDQCWMALALQTGREYNGKEIVIERPDGSRVTTLAHANPVFDDSGNLAGAVNVLVDISDRKKSEAALVALKDQLATQLIDLERLHAMSLRLSKSLELAPILEETLRTVVAFEGADFGLLSLYDSQEKRLVVGASLGFDEDFLQAIGRTPPGGRAIGCMFSGTTPDRCGKPG